MNGPLPNNMYQIKPVFCLPDILEISNNMYKMKSIHSTSFQSSNSVEAEKAVALEKTPKNEYEDIHERQIIILQQLTYLQYQMSLLRKRINENVPPVKNSECVTSVKSNSDTMKPSFEQGGVIYDVVINANPSHPPYSLLAISKLWGDRLSITVTSHVHSTITAVPKVNQMFQILQDSDNNNGSNRSSLNITLVWKEMGTDCELIVCPLRHTAIRGEVNVLRYLHRHLDSPDCLDPISETRLDSLLDRCHSLRHAATAKEKKSIVKALNAALGKGEWLGGGDSGAAKRRTLSIADVALWSAVRAEPELELTQSLAKWLERCNSAIGLGA